MSSEFLGRASYYTVRVDKIALKTLFCIKSKKTEQAEISELACEFTTHYECKNEGMNLKSTTANRCNFQIIESLMES